MNRSIRINIVAHNSNKNSYISVADPGGRGLPPPPRFFFACQYIKIPADLDPNPPPPPLKNYGPEPPPPLEEFLDPPLHIYLHNITYIFATQGRYKTKVNTNLDNTFTMLSMIRWSYSNSVLNNRSSPRWSGGWPVLYCNLYCKL